MPGEPARECLADGVRLVLRRVMAALARRLHFEGGEFVKTGGAEKQVGHRGGGSQSKGGERSVMGASRTPGFVARACPRRFSRH